MDLGLAGRGRRSRRVQGGFSNGVALGVDGGGGHRPALNASDSPDAFQPPTPGCGRRRRPPLTAPTTPQELP